MQQGSSGNAGTAGASATATLTDEQILGLDSAGALSDDSAVAQVVPDGLGRGDLRFSPEHTAGTTQEQSPGSPRPGAQAGEDPSYSNNQQRQPRAVADAAEPEWLKSLDAQPEAAAEARRWRQAAQDTAALDADYFSADPGARAGLAARLHESDPAAFRAMLADAARLLAERDPQGLAELARQLGAAEPIAPGSAAKSVAQAARSVNPASAVAQAGPVQPGRPEAVSGASTFPADAYRAFEAATNDDVARQVRDSIDRTLTATLPEGIADGARRRIGDDIFRDLNATLSADRALSGQINDLLRGWRFDPATRQQLAGLLTGRARTVLPEVARRVVSEWTSSVLASDRAKNARIESAASRRDITGGRLPEPVASSALRPRPVDYARTSDEQILEM